MPSFDFTGKNILNGSLVPESGNLPAYKIETTKIGKHARGVTTLSGTPAASISWPERSFTIGGETLPLDNIECKVWVDGKLKSARIWQWEKTEYELHFWNGEWTVKDCSSSSSPDVVVAQFRSATSHVLHKNTPARLTLSCDVQPAELAFLLLALIYSEFRRADIAAPHFFGTGPPVGMFAFIPFAAAGSSC
ncbi:hypothetical protein BD626DRAFT_157242 [Schizophyllum amplum]|uniref:Tubby C-terminal-like domain-containing protein n=1 Tax=Schizophyllum amplum TaxID=97359 RepID=A0A550C350_9AGAR|nr:hypothetical protein BD626DRAFT_157242 [Auriculariopsis ampla]